MAKSSAKEMLAELLLPPIRHFMVLLVLLAVSAPHYLHLPWPSTHRAHIIHLVEDTDTDLDLGLGLGLDSTPVPHSPLAVEDDSLNDGLLSL